MSAWENPYYTPEKFGLTIVDVLDASEDYSFDYLVLWAHDDGRLFWARDSGCSCPSPFEEYHRLDDLTELTNEGWDAFEEALEEFADYRDSDQLRCDKVQMMAVASRLLPEVSIRPVLETAAKILD